MSQRITDAVVEVIEAEVVKYGDQFSWDYALNVLPTAQGPQAMGLFIMTMKNPLLGTGDIAIIQMIPDITAVTRHEPVAKLVADAVQQLRDQHAENLKV